LSGLCAKAHPFGLAAEKSEKVIISQLFLFYYPKRLAQKLFTRFPIRINIF